MSTQDPNTPGFLSGQFKDFEPETDRDLWPALEGRLDALPAPKSSRRTSPAFWAFPLILLLGGGLGLYTFKDSGLAPGAKVAAPTEAKATVNTSSGIVNSPGKGLGLKSETSSAPSPGHRASDAGPSEVKPQVVIANTHPTIEDLVPAQEIKTAAMLTVEVTSAEKPKVRSTKANGTPKAAEAITGADNRGTIALAAGAATTQIVNAGVNTTALAKPDEIARPTEAIEQSSQVNFNPIGETSATATKAVDTHETTQQPEGAETVMTDVNKSGAKAAESEPSVPRPEILTFEKANANPSVDSAGKQANRTVMAKSPIKDSTLRKAEEPGSRSIRYIVGGGLFTPIRELENAGPNQLLYPTEPVNKFNTSLGQEIFVQVGRKEDAHWEVSARLGLTHQRSRLSYILGRYDSSLTYQDNNRPTLYDSGDGFTQTNSRWQIYLAPGATAWLNSGKVGLRGALRIGYEMQTIGKNEMRPGASSLTPVHTPDVKRPSPHLVLVPELVVVVKPWKRWLIEAQLRHQRFSHPSIANLKLRSREYQIGLMAGYIF